MAMGQRQATLDYEDIMGKRQQRQLNDLKLQELLNPKPQQMKLEDAFKMQALQHYQLGDQLMQQGNARGAQQEYSMAQRLMLIGTGSSGFLPKEEKTPEPMSIGKMGQEYEDLIKFFGPESQPMRPAAGWLPMIGRAIDMVWPGDNQWGMEPTPPAQGMTQLQELLGSQGYNLNRTFLDALARRHGR
jgi:hypothetical protein